MIINLIKNNGNFCPANDMDKKEFDKLKKDTLYSAKIQLVRNPKFHRKTFSFLKFCFEHWNADRANCQFMNEKAQFDYFRNQLTILAGYYNTCYNLNGNMILTPKSLSFDKMSESEFKDFYSAIIDAAINHIFINCDQKTEDKLRGFF